MRSIGVLLLMFFLVAGASAQDKSKTPVKEMSYSGYVIDEMCGSGMVKKTDSMQKVAAHTRDCALSKSCAASGFGLFSEGKWVAFDKKGSAMAKSMLEKSKRDDHLYAEVDGTMKGKVLVVKSIKEADPPKN